MMPAATCVDPSRPWARLRLHADRAGVTVSGGPDRLVFVPWAAIADIDVTAVSGVFGTRFAVVLDVPGAPRRLLFPRWGLLGFDPARAVDVAAVLRRARLDARPATG